MMRPGIFRKRNYFFIVVDVIMMLLLILNLSIIIFDWMYDFEWTQQLLSQHLPAFNAFYDENIHRHFLEIDLIFISIFLAEFLMSWIISMARREFSKWFFYPIFHWYDLLGCIPLNAFRFVRVLRIYSIIVRLHKLGMIDLRNTYFYKKYEKYYDILVEEVSDRVVVNVLSGMQDEIRGGGRMIDRIVHDILKPKKEAIAQWMSHRIQTGVDAHYSERKQELRLYVDQVIEDAVRNTEAVSKLDRLPVMGDIILSAVKLTISDVVFQVIDTLLADLGSDRNKAVVGGVADFVFESVEFEERDDHLRRLVEDTLIESLEVVKEQVNVKQWKLKEEVDKQLSGAGNGSETTENPGAPLNP